MTHPRDLSYEEMLKVVTNPDGSYNIGLVLEWAQHSVQKTLDSHNKEN